MSRHLEVPGSDRRCLSLREPETPQKLPPGLRQRRMCGAIAPKCCALVMTAVLQSAHLHGNSLLGQLLLRLFAWLAYLCCRKYLGLSRHTSRDLMCGRPMLCSSLDARPFGLCNAPIPGKGVARHYLTLATHATSSADLGPVFLALLS